MVALAQLYQRYVEKHRLILEKLEQAFKRNKKFEQVYRDFETQKVCYLPLNTFLVRPLQRILHYQLIADRLVKLVRLDISLHPRPPTSPLFSLLLPRKTQYNPVQPISTQ